MPIMPMKTRNLPVGTWMVVEASTKEVNVLSTHTGQGEAEAECNRRNAGLPSPRYCACIALEPVAERMGRAPG